MLEALAIGKQRALRPQGDDHFTGTGLDQLGRRHLGAVNRVDHHAAQCGGFTFIGDQVVDRGIPLSRQWTAGWGWVEDHRLAQLAAALEGVAHRIHRHFQLADDHVSRLQHRVERLQRGRCQFAIAARHDHNRVLAAVIDHDQRHATGALHGADSLAINALHPQCVTQLSAIGIGADAADHRHIGAQSRRSDGLVRALSARHGGKCLPDERFTGTRQPAGAGHQVHVQAAYYHYFCWHTSVLINSVQRYWANVPATGAVDSRNTMLGVTMR